VISSSDNDFIIRRRYYPRLTITLITDALQAHDVS
jgi:hypothetical protein